MYHNMAFQPDPRQCLFLCGEISQPGEFVFRECVYKPQLRVKKLSVRHPVKLSMKRLIGYETPCETHGDFTDKFYCEQNKYKQYLPCTKNLQKKFYVSSYNFATCLNFFSKYGIFFFALIMWRLGHWFPKQNALCLSQNALWQYSE